MVPGPPPFPAATDAVRLLPAEAAVTPGVVHAQPIDLMAVPAAPRVVSRRRAGRASSVPARPDP